jgi:hypothetical protein
LLDAYTRQPSAYDCYLANLLEERERLRAELINTSAEIIRASQAEGERSAQLYIAETARAEMILRVQNQEMALLETRARLLASTKKNICVWGAGTGGVRALNYLRGLRIDVHAFMDSDDSKIGKGLRKRPVLAPSVLGKKTWRRRDSGIFIASHARQQIEKHLGKIGWRDGVDYLNIPQSVLDVT